MANMLLNLLYFRVRAVNAKHSVLLLKMNTVLSNLNRSLNFQDPLIDLSFRVKFLGWNRLNYPQNIVCMLKRLEFQSLDKILLFLGILRGSYLNENSAAVVHVNVIFYGPTQGTCH